MHSYQTNNAEGSYPLITIVLNDNNFFLSKESFKAMEVVGRGIYGNERERVASVAKAGFRPKQL